MLNICRLIMLFGVCPLVATPLISGQLSAQERAPSRASYHLVQLSIKADQIPLEEFRAKTEEIRSCRDATDLAKSLGAEVKRDRFVPSWDLPVELRMTLAELPTGHATQVFSEDISVMRVIVICSRNA